MMQALSDLNGFKSAHGISDARVLAIGEPNHDGAFNNADLQALQAKETKPILPGNEFLDPGQPRLHAFMQELRKAGSLIWANTGRGTAHRARTAGSPVGKAHSPC